MQPLSTTIANLIGPALAGRDLGAVAAGFQSSLAPFGLTAIYARDYRSSPAPGRPARVYARIAPSGLDDMYADRRFYDHNPIPRIVRQRTMPMLWSEMPWKGMAQQWIRHAMRDCGCPDGIAIPCHGPSNSFGLMSLAFERLESLAPHERRAIEMAGLIVYDHLRRLVPHEAADCDPQLSQREQDCLAFIADGYSDGDIARAMTVSRATVASHVMNARTKLGAKTRSQAVALFLRGRWTDR